MSDFVQLGNSTMPVPRPSTGDKGAKGGKKSSSAAGSSTLGMVPGQSIEALVAEAQVAAKLEALPPMHDDPRHTHDAHYTTGMQRRPPPAQKGGHVKEHAAMLPRRDNFRRHTLEISQLGGGAFPATKGSKAAKGKSSASSAP